MLKRMFCASASILMLALACHFGAQNARAQSETIPAAEAFHPSGTREVFFMLEKYITLPAMTHAAFTHLLTKWGFVPQGGFSALSDTQGHVIVIDTGSILNVIFRPPGNVEVAPAIVAGLIQKSVATTLREVDELDVVIDQESEGSFGLGAGILKHGMSFSLSSGLWTGTYLELTLGR